MRELTFALEFRGKAWPVPGPVPGTTGKRQAKTAAPSQIQSSIIGPQGVAARIEAVPGEQAMLGADIERFADGSFVETGTISFGSAGRIEFETVGRGTVGPSRAEGWQHGAVIWKVTSGDGMFAGCTGLVTSNFIVNQAGDVIDNHVARLYLAIDAPP
jgi:hypothetical protein